MESTHPGLVGVLFSMSGGMNFRVYVLAGD